MGWTPHGKDYILRANFIFISIMKTLHKTKTSSCRIEAKNLTLGDLIAATYSTCGEQGASKILRMAMEAHVIKFSQPPFHYEP